MKTYRYRRFKVGIAAALLAATALTLSYHEVDNTINAEDIRYIHQFLPEEEKSRPSDPENYESQIRFINAVQQAVLKRAPGNTGIAYNQRREPRDLYLSQSGLCYDRSRVIEKILRYRGFKTRHIAIYSRGKNGSKSAIRALMTPDVSSHAVTETLTGKGWLVVDSNAPWISLGADGRPVSIEEIQKDTSISAIPWETPIMNDIYREPFTYIYGLYSRHGRFYPPYNFIPDVNYSEMIHHFL